MSKLNKSMVIALVGLAGLSSAASAHPKVTQTTPAANAALAASPKEIRLSFNETLEANFSGAEIQNQSGQKVQTGKVSTDPKDPKQMVIPLSSPLPAGTYNVVWHAVAADSHRVKGSYSFTVKP
jgi:copper resistance protein C